MARTLGIGKQDFEKVRKENAFYIDKTKFIREWWESEDDVTLITRPRRFGKTLNMSMLEKFFSVQFAGRGDLFCGLAIWEDEKYRRLQGTYPVLFISFADVKETTYIQTKKKICRIIKALYNKYDLLYSEITLLQEPLFQTQLELPLPQPELQSALHLQQQPLQVSQQSLPYGNGLLR